MISNTAEPLGAQSFARGLSVETPLAMARGCLIRSWNGGSD